MSNRDDPKPVKSRFTIFELQPGGAARPEDPPAAMRHVLPWAIRIVRQAGGRTASMLLGAQIMRSVLLLSSLLAGRELLEQMSRDAVATSRAIPLTLVLGLLLGAVMATRVAQQELSLLLAELVSRDVERRVLRRTASESLILFEDPNFHDAVARVLGRSQVGPFRLVEGLVRIAQFALTAAAALLALVLIAPVMIPAALLVSAIGWWVSTRRGQASFRFIGRMTPADRERRYMAQLLSERRSAAEVRAYGLQETLLRRHAFLFAERIAEFRALLVSHARLSAYASLFIALVVAGLLTVIVVLRASGDLSLSSATAAIVALVALGQQAAAASSGGEALRESTLFAADLRHFLGDSAPIPQLERVDVTEIEVRGVSFSYPGSETPAVANVSLRLTRGAIVALVGPNGSGKSTLAKLVAGLYQPSHGTIVAHGASSDAANEAGLASACALMLQDYQHYALAARQNIEFGDPTKLATQEAICAAAAKAGIDETLTQLPAGYDTILGPEFIGGVDLSAGQWQRVALARAYFRDAGFLVLDEPTSALDAKAEERLFTTLRDLLTGRGALLISHRFATVRFADEILVMDAGRIVEHGSHGDLMLANGLYADMYRTQAANYQL